jgi:hypothetical protein
VASRPPWGYQPGSAHHGRTSVTIPKPIDLADRDVLPAGHGQHHERRGPPTIPAGFVKAPPPGLEHVSSANIRGALYRKVITDAAAEPASTWSAWGAPWATPAVATPTPAWTTRLRRRGPRRRAATGAAS